MRHLMGILLLLAFVPAWGWATGVSVRAPQPSVLVSTIPVTRGTLPQMVTAYGMVDALVNGARNLSRAYAGQVQELYVGLGQPVKPGQALFKYAADPSALRDYQQAVSAQQLAKNEVVRTQQMYDLHLATNSQLDQAKKTLSDANVALWVQAAQGASQGVAVIRAPFAGVITSLSASVGDRLAANSPVLQVTRGAGLAVNLGLPLDQAAGVKVGNPVQLVGLDLQRSPIVGSVTAVASALDPKTRLINVVVTVSAVNATTMVQGEQYRALIQTGVYAGVIVPRAAVLKDQQGAYIYQASPQAHRVGVRLMGEAGDQYVIEGGLNPRQSIISAGNYVLQEGMAVRLAAPAKPATRTAP